MKGIVKENVAYFRFRDEAFVRSQAGIDYDKGFALKIRLEKLPKEAGQTLLLKTDGFELSFVRKSAADREAFSRTEKSDRVWLYADEQGFVNLLEMKANFLSPYMDEPREMICELVLRLFDASEREAYFVYDGVRFFWVFDGETVNQDYPFGSVVLSRGELVVGDLVADWGLASAQAVQKETRTETTEKNMAFFSPRGYNAWAGDVVNFYKDGVYHLIYFFDRHHHGSRWGGGGHTMYQMTTTDFIHWEDHGSFINLNEQWKSVGTGTMFFHNGKYYYSHGWHTSRMVPFEKTGSKLLQEKTTENCVSSISYDEIRENGLVPAGANFVVSDDGIRFKDGRVQFHIAENPSVYAEADGTLTMFAGYGGTSVWKADDIKGPWREKGGDFAMHASPMKPSTECPSRFALGGYTYLLVGGTGFWQTEKDGAEFKDMAKDGYDVYDGMFVPMVTKTDDGRLIYGGWMQGYGWGSMITHRELVQGENGRLYMKWLPELAPQAEELEAVDGFAMDERASYYFEADIRSSATAKIVLRLIGERDDALTIDSAKETAQISEIEKGAAYPEEILPAFEKVKRGIEVPHHGVCGNFTLGRVDHIKNDYKLRVIVYYEKKFDAVTIDAEIGGLRTLVSHRIDKRFSSLSWSAENAEVMNAKLYRIK